MAEWEPLLIGSEADVVRETVLKLASVVADGALTAPGDGSLGSGWAGNAVLFNELASAGFGAEWRAAASNALTHALDAVEEKPHRPMLYAGLAGVAWAADRLRVGSCADEFVADQDLNGPIDDVLLELLAKPVWHDTYDLLSGLAGYGVYGLGRLDQPSGRSCVDRVVALLLRWPVASPDESGVWFTPPGLIPTWQVGFAPRGYYNLGISHGVPGVICLLSHVAHLGLERTILVEKVRSAVEWMLQQECEFPDGPWFPCWRGPGVEDAPSKIAWCYGDLGPAIALLTAGRVFDSPAWVTRASEIALRSIDRSRRERITRDAGLCHGTAGIAHVFTRFAHATGDARFADAAREWVRRTLEFAYTQGGKLTGYPCLHLDESGARHWSEGAGVLEGASGIALALASVVSDRPPTWDSVMALDIPPCESRTH